METSDRIVSPGPDRSRSQWTQSHMNNDDGFEFEREEQEASRSVNGNAAQPSECRRDCAGWQKKPGACRSDRVSRSVRGTELDRDMIC